MQHTFTPAIRPFVASCINETLRSPRYIPRQPITTYSQGTRVSNNGNAYIAIRSGTTGTGPGPSATSGITLDGTIEWLALGQDTAPDGVINANLYLGIGKQTEWANPSVPPVPTTTPTSEAEIKDALTALIQINANNVRLGMTKNAWQSGVVYSAWHPDINIDDYSTPFYVTADDKVYKCLDNNMGAPSTVMPNETSAGLIQKSDGYVWKYIGMIPLRDMLDFSTASLVPMPQSVVTDYVDGTISSYDSLVTTAYPFDATDDVTIEIVGSGTGATAGVRMVYQDDTKSVAGFFSYAEGAGYDEDTIALVYESGIPGYGAIVAPIVSEGAVTAVEVLALGDEYLEASVIIIGDGTGAVARPVVSGGKLVTIIMDSQGTGYTWAKAYVIPGVKGAASRAILGPAGGHGSDLETELSVSSVLISCRLASNLNDYIPTSGVSSDSSFRQISLLGGVISQPGSTRNAPALIGPAHDEWEAVTLLDKYERGSGSVIYVNNIVAIEHTATQEEIIKVSVTL